MIGRTHYESTVQLPRLNALCTRVCCISYGSTVHVISFLSYSRVDCWLSSRGFKEGDRGGAQDSRVISVVASSTRGLSRDSPATKRKSIVVATRPMSKRGWRTEVRLGLAMPVNGISSKP